MQRVARAACVIDQLLGGDGNVSETWVTEAEDKDEDFYPNHSRNEIKLAARQVAATLPPDRGINSKVNAQVTGGQDSSPLGQIRLEVDHIPLSERIGNFKLVEQGYDQKSAGAEAIRCLDCDIHAYEVEVKEALCKDCGYCREICLQGVFEQSEFFNAQGYRPIKAAAKDKCVGCLKCLMICPDHIAGGGKEILITIY